MRLITLILLCAFSAQAQTDPLKQNQLSQNIRGTVLDNELESPLIGARIVLMGEQDTLKTGTDIDGNFRFNKVNIGRYNLHISMIGYESANLAQILLESGKELVLNINLQEDITSMSTLIIDGSDPKGSIGNEMATVSARSFSVEETSKDAGSFTDPGRMAQSFAGVSSNNDESNGIVIRGNSPRGVLWRMEGIEIPNPNHFSDQGASGGAISMLNSNVMANSDFYTGAFPADYGNALSGVFDINLRKGNNQKREYSLGAGVLGLDATLEGPFKKGYGGSYLINYRYSTLKVLNLIGLDIAGDALPVFQDISYNFSLPTRKAGNFTIFGLGGISIIEENIDDYRGTFKVQMGVTGVTHKLPIGKKSILKTVLAISATSNDYKDEELDSTGEFYNDINSNFNNSTLSATSSLTTKLNSKHTLKTGVIASRLGFDMFIDDMDESTWMRVKSLDSEGNTWMLQGYSTWKWRLTEGLSFTGGLHATHFALTQKQYLEPRAGFRWQLSEKHTLSAGFGKHSRREDLSIYFAERTNSDGSIINPNIDLGFTQALHYVLGYEVKLAKNLYLKSEAYYQDLNNVPIVDDNTSFLSAINFSSPFTTNTLANAGTGKNYGLEFTLERYFTDGLFYMITASVFDSKYTAGDGIERNTRFNGNYATNWSLGKEFKLGKSKTNILGFSLRANWAGGRRITPILLDASIAAGYQINDLDRIYEDKADDYIRLDFQCSYRINKKKSTRIIKLDIQNATNRANMWVEYYDNDIKSISKATQTGLIPVLSYQIIF